MGEGLEMEFAEHFMDACKYDGISTEYPELDDRKYKSNYDRIIKEIMASNPVEDNKNYKKLEKEEVIYRAVIIVKYLLGEAISNDVLFAIANQVVVTDAESVMDGYSLDVTDMRNGRKYDIITVPGMNKTISVVCLVGVLIHYLERNKKIKTYDNYRYTFTMSYIAEAIAAKLFDMKDEENELLSKLRALRLDAIKFQQNASKATEELLKKMPMVMQMPKFEPLYTYEKSRNYAYLLGFINQICLLDRYLDDEKTFTGKMNAVFNGEITVPGVLDYYGIDLHKKEIADEVIGVVKKYK